MARCRINSWHSRFNDAAATLIRSFGDVGSVGESGGFITLRSAVQVRPSPFFDPYEGSYAAGSSKGAGPRCYN